PCVRTVLCRTPTNSGTVTNQLATLGTDLDAITTGVYPPRTWRGCNHQRFVCRHPYAIAGSSK
ncbi:MAG: hypothetical protein ACO37D_07075, partial [Rhodothermales bacterium]